MKTTLVLLFVCVALVGCGDSSSNTAADMAMAAVDDLSMSVDMTGPLSRCGHPGDTGNSLGVGQYCNNGGPDCTGSKATLCSALANGMTPMPSDSYFCSFFCMATDPPGTCGENASCLCNSSGCACIPDSCIPPDMGP